MEQNPTPKPLCSYEICPLKDSCNCYREVLAHWQKKNFLWWAIYPFEAMKGRCFEAKPIDPKNDN
jgi:hypothetical protein